MKRPVVKGDRPPMFLSKADLAAELSASVSTVDEWRRTRSRRRWAVSPKIELPRGVHRVKARGRDYFYFQPGRGTPNAGARVRLPDDPRSPEFWTAVRQLEGIAERTDTIGALIDAYIASWP